MKCNIRYVATVDRLKISSYIDECLPVEKVFGEITDHELTQFVTVGVEESFGGEIGNSCNVFEHAVDSYLEYVTELSIVDVNEESIINSHNSSVIGLISSEVYISAIKDLHDFKLGRKNAKITDSRYLGKSDNNLHFLLNIECDEIENTPHEYG